jgi:hypothetical protein
LREKNTNFFREKKTQTFFEIAGSFPHSQLASFTIKMANSREESEKVSISKSFYNQFKGVFYIYMNLHKSILISACFLWQICKFLQETFQVSQQCLNNVREHKVSNINL